MGRYRYFAGTVLFPQRYRALPLPLPLPHRYQTVTATFRAKYKKLNVRYRSLQKLSKKPKNFIAF